ncbi:MAG: hypothetical protein WBA11_13480, partial [Rubrivirga sp.]
RAEALVGSRWQIGLSGRWSDHSLRQRYDALDGAAAGLEGTEPTAEAEARLVSALDAFGETTNGNDLDNLTLGLDATVAIARGQTLAFGLEGVSVGTRFHLLSAGFGETAFRDLDAAHRQTRVAAVVDGRHEIGRRWTLEPGLRLTTLTSSGDVLAEPRLALRYDAAPGDRVLGIPMSGVAGRLAAGVYRQFATRVELATFGPSTLVPDVPVWLPIDSSIDAPSSLHVAGEILWRPSERWSTRIEGYAKTTPQTYDLDYSALLARIPGALTNQSDFLIEQHGRSAGIGIRVERQSPRWASSVGLMVARAEQQSDQRFRGAWVSSPWEEPVRATADLDVLAFGQRDGTGLLLRARALGVWGRSWALRRAYYDVIGAQRSTLDSFSLSAPQNDQLAPSLMLDVGAAYTARLGTGQRLEVALDVTNVLDRPNVLDWSLRPGVSGALEAVTRTLPGIQPALRVRVSI